MTMHEEAMQSEGAQRLMRGLSEDEAVKLYEQARMDEAERIMEEYVGEPRGTLTLTVAFPYHPQRLIFSGGRCIALEFAPPHAIAAHIESRSEDPVHREFCAVLASVLPDFQRWADGREKPTFGAFVRDRGYLS